MLTLPTRRLLPRHPLLACVLACAACNVTGRDMTGEAAPAAPTAAATQPAIPFDPLSPRAQVSKVKNLLTGLPPTDAEVAAVTANPAAMGDQVAAWQQTPEFTPKMLTFLANAFQQSQVVASDFTDQGVNLMPGDPSNNQLSQMESDLLVQNLREVMARTALQGDLNGQPFTDVATTTRFMMTPPVATYYAYLDGISYTDGGTLTDSYAAMAMANGSKVPTFRAAMDTFSAADFANWQPYTIRQPNPGEAPTPFYGSGVRSAGTLVLKTPRRGYFTTPTFFASWPTNTGNVARLTMNQTMIVGLGRAFDGDVPVQPVSLAALDSAHAAPNTPCFGCHVNMDPMRQFLRGAYTLHFAVQADPNMMKIPGQFAFGTVVASGQPTKIDVLAQSIASHPYFAQAWVMKLCAYANDGACLATDPEVQRLTGLFSQSGYRLSTLVNAMFSSPLVTQSAGTETALTLMDKMPVTKRDHLCPLLSTRLGISDVCGLSATTQVQGNMVLVRTIAAVMPADGYSRAGLQPVFANDPSLFFRAGLENICAQLASQVVDQSAGPGAMSLSSDQPQAAVATLATGLMGESGARASAVTALLQAHFDQGIALGQAPADVLRSTFVAACLSPAVAGMAQ